MATPTLTLASDVQWLRGVGPKVAERLARLNIHHVQDALFHLPFRYQDRTQLIPIGGLQLNQEALFEGEVLLSEVTFRKRRTLLVRLADGTGQITLRFFHFSKTQQENLLRGVRIRCFGEVRGGNSGLEIVHPEYRVVQENETVAPYLTPIYPTTEGVQQATWQRIIEQALDLLAHDELADLLPANLLSQQGLPDLKTALQIVHRPTPDMPLQPLLAGEHVAQQRLAFEELIAHHLSMLQLRQRKQQQAAPSIRVAATLRKKLLAALPFKLTNAQQRVVAELNADLEKTTPAMRLIQGDVGSGKTVVAALVAADVVAADYQVAVMAPTELLAEQHYKNFSQWLAPLNIKVGWYSGRLKGKQRELEKLALANGEVQLVVGTHALFQEDVSFKKLALLIIDEQHRFGVHQRLALRNKGVRETEHPHQFTMTATPIPRSLAMTAYADLDYSVIDELPPGRIPVNTVVMTESRRDEIIERIANACVTGRQAYWVCTLIEESEMLQCQAAEDTAVQLTEKLPQLRIGLIHGRMKGKEKETVMAAFKSAQLDLLVATTVIEVGVDVPNASLMIIENAERLGLSQLHQLRGRVGRGSAASNCVLMYKSPLSARARMRLDVLRHTNDGFEIAQQDLNMRGPGELLGTRQTGDVDFQIANLARDAKLLPDVQAVAKVLLVKYPDNAMALMSRWLGHKQQFREV
ncbi:MAG: ATP-dependent DNA helicase RecG [Gammaproteobacteria bacterium]|nr:ATP-dependent DNA helicase RecG [Gammaproteobacteria bacterium]